jgi:hypothetical protein
MIHKPARYFSFPTWAGPGHTTGTGRPSGTSPMSRASAGRILRAPARPGRVVKVEEASLFESAVQRAAAYASTPWCLTFA